MKVVRLIGGNNMAKDNIQKFSKGAFLQSTKYEFLRYRDVLKVLLKDGEFYAEAEVMEKLKTYLNKEV